MSVGMTQKNQVLMDRLAAGESPHELIRQGHPKSTINRLAGRVERGESSAPSPQSNGADRTPRRPSPSQGSSDPSATIVRFTQEQIVLPGNLFLLYDHMRRIYPRYRATKSQWILDVIQCWAEERSEEMGLNPMSWTSEPRMLVEDEEEDDQQLPEFIAGEQHDEPEPGLQAERLLGESAEAEPRGESAHEPVLGERGDSDGDESGGEGSGDDGGGE